MEYSRHLYFFRSVMFFSKDNSTYRPSTMDACFKIMEFYCSTEKKRIGISLFVKGFYMDNFCIQNKSPVNEGLRALRHGYSLHAFALH